MATFFSPGSADYGHAFISGRDIPGGSDEYYLRDIQASRIFGCERSYRSLAAAEIAELEARGNRSGNWDEVLVTDGAFDTALVSGCTFSGLVRIGELAGGLLRCHDYTLPVGLRSSRIIACDIGDRCAIQDVGYLSRFILGDEVILSNIGEMDTTNHAKFGEGVVKAGEDESVRTWIYPINENGGRGVLPFNGMIAADAYLWAVYREDGALMDSLKAITQAGLDSRRGYYGTIGKRSAIKHCLIIKDFACGDGVYIKGANKLKNITVKSDLRDPTQIGEGVELVNGIVGYGCRVFYGCKAVRFVLGDNASLKYGARLINSILGDNSTVSCCEVLHNLVFPAHEQHHNNSFLIASLVMGQSNLAAGATVGSNHNSRGNDGEILAGRGFWPGLSCTLKHNCLFASFALVAKGNYPMELNIPLPFSLVTADSSGSRREVMPAYWWMHNLYALERNQQKFKDRDHREFPAQRYETAYLAPDTAAEIIRALALLEAWTEKWGGGGGDLERLHAGEDFTLLVGGRTLERSGEPVRIIKPASAYTAYREMLIWYAVTTLLEHTGTSGVAFAAVNTLQNEQPGGVSLKWINLGGQLVMESKVDALRADIREGRLKTWEAIHEEYGKFAAAYQRDKALNALQVLRVLAEDEAENEDETATFGDGAVRSPEKRAAKKITEQQWRNFTAEALRIREYIEEQVLRTKQKDYTDPFRAITYRNKDEQEAVLGTPGTNPFLRAYGAQYPAKPPAKSRKPRRPFSP